MITLGNFPAGSNTAWWNQYMYYLELHMYRHLKSADTHIVCIIKTTEKHGVLLMISELNHLT